MQGSESPRLAVISFHTSPVAQAGGRDAGGMNVYVRESARALAQRGMAVDLFTRADGPGPTVQSLAEGVRLVRIDAGPRRAVRKDALPALVPAFVHGLAAFRGREGRRYDLIQSHYWLSGVAGLHLSRRWSVAHAVMFHTLGAVKNRARLGESETPARIAGERAVAAGADRVVCATAHERALLQRLYGVDGTRAAIVPCGVDDDLFQPLDRAAARRGLGLPADEPLLVFAGRIEPLKGLDVAIAALAALDAPRPLLLIVGGDKQAAGEVRRLQALAAREGVAERVRFVGSVPQIDLPAYYSAADICIAPSYYESFGMAALEAQACGTPVVASRVGGLPDVVRDGETGYLVPWRCPQPFAERLDLLLHNPALRARMGVSAREQAQRFRWSEIAARLASLYGAMLTERALRGCHPSEPAEPALRHEDCDVA